MKKWIKKMGGWVLSISTAILIGIISKASEDIPFFSSIWKGICWLWNKFIWIINLEFRLWWILAFLTTIYLLLIILNRIYDSIRPQAKDDSPKFIDYKEDEIENIIFIWNWNKDYDGWHITNLKALCPIDRTPIDSLTHICPRCHTNPYLGKMIDYDNISRIIEDNIRKRSNE